MADGKTADERPRVRLDRPVLTQVGALGEGYHAWVHRSISPNAAVGANRAALERGERLVRRWPDSLRLFRNPVLEALSHVRWWVIPLLWIPIVTGLYVSACVWAGLPWGMAWRWALLGLALWTLAEYALHRWIFHYRPRTAFGRSVHFLAHGIHHLDPWDRTRLVFPPVAAIIVACGLFVPLWLVLPLSAALASMSGLLVGYIVYDLTHYYTHHARPRTRWGKFLKAWHLAHHHKYWTSMYGVSSPLWDIVFRTGRPSSGKS